MERETQPPIKICVISVSAGAGHGRAAEALVAAAGCLPNVQAVHLDVMDLVGGVFRKTYASGYIRMVDKHPHMWGVFYRITDRPQLDSALNRFIQAFERFNARRLKTWLRDYDPDHVICTHFLPAQFLSRMRAKGTWQRPVWVAVTDFDCHSLWLHPHLSGYFAASDEVAWRLRERGVAGSGIETLGIPIMPVFGEALDRGTCANEIGIDPQRTTLLMMSGGAGLGGNDALVQRLLELPHAMQIIVLAGRNQALLARLKTIAAAHPGRLIPMGFTTTIQRVMACSDIAITKPGGLTTSECLAVGLPMIVVSPIPGQEERNADYLVENGAALKAYDAATLSYRVDLLLRDPARRNAMRHAAAALGRPRAAQDILQVVLDDAGAGPTNGTGRPHRI